MAYRTRTYYTDSQKALMWERWKQGWTLHQIAELIGRTRRYKAFCRARAAFDRRSDAVPRWH